MNIKIGDTVKSKEPTYGECFTGIVRHAGRLNGYGHENSIWSSWEHEFDGVLAPSGNGGNLLHMSAESLNIIKRKNVFEGKSRG